MNKRYYLNNDWYFTENWSDDLLTSFDVPSEMIPVRLPHTCRETSLHYFNETEYQMLCGYVRYLDIPEDWRGKKLLLTFEGAAHEATVYVNGKRVGKHSCGYTAFTLDISDYVFYGNRNLVSVKLDSRESLNIPPFGFVIDYMTYGGIYRDVYLDVKEPIHIKHVFIHTDRISEINIGISEIELSSNAKNDLAGMKLSQHIRLHGSGEAQAFRPLQESDASSAILSFTAPDTQLWDTENPVLYDIKTDLLSPSGDVVDSVITTIGFRTAVFEKDGFYLNGIKTKIRGLNRHQSYPYVGYAMPDSMQRRDAEIAKFELGLNALRTSHYPQSHAFLDRCDELGILVFTELPGWQHIGDIAWKQQAMENLKEMILQYRNHPSIVLWGVRINESVDDDPFYSKTNSMAKALDPTRQTGGVRCYKKGSFLEDVYTYNDFIHAGNNAGCEKKSSVTSDTSKAYMITEYNGHMFPTKAFDDEEHRLEHALRHARVLDDVTKHEDICGSFGWCMFDYNTHQDFGSGDRICYHGVMDMFRNPKIAAAVYASQQDERPVLEVSSSMDLGEHPGSNRGDVYVFTNADSVCMYKNGTFIKEYKPLEEPTGPFKYLDHPPILVDDFIGDMLQDEGMSHAQTDALKDLLNETARRGLYRLSKKALAKASVLLLRYRMTMDDAVKLYNKYIGDWGGSATSWEFVAYKDDQEVGRCVKSPMQKKCLFIEADHTTLKEEKSYDVAAVRIRMTDENGNVLPYANDPVVLDVSGPIELIGPTVISLSGGMGGTYIRSTGKSGNGILEVITPDGLSQKIDFTI